MTITTTFTALEQAVIDQIRHFQTIGEDAYPDEIRIEGQTMKTIRGALGSLVKKGAIDIDWKEKGLISLYVQG